jgi:hypothetical protein
MRTSGQASVLALLYLQWSAVFLGWPFGRAYLIYVFQLATFARTGNMIFPYTLLSATALFLASFYIFHEAHLSTPVTLLLAFGLTFGAVSVFEDIYQNMVALYGIGSQHADWRGQILNASAILMIIPSAYFWKASRTLYAVIGAYIAGWLIWIVTGFPQIYGPNPGTALPLNILLKIWTFILFLVLLLPNRLQIP